MQSIFKICCLSLLFSAHAFNRPMRSHKFVTKMSSENGFAELVKNIRTYTLPAIIGASLLLAPHNADALPSGGRGGGSSFRSAPTRSSSRSYSSRSYSSSSTVFVPVPSYSPFGFGFGYATPFFFPPISFNTLVLAGAIAGAYYLLSNRVGGSDFSNSEDEGMLGSGATVIKLQLSLDADWSSGNIMETLATIAASNGGPSSRSSLSQLLSETSLALLRRQRDWNSVAYEGQKFNRFEGQQIEPYYQKVAVKERTKFETETSPVATLKGTTSRVSTQAVTDHSGRYASSVFAHR
jgi:uncharacterized membrane protein